ncbi:MAG: hypothetical protein H0V09_00950 [Gemmatimonadetes bacterium]|nr:hypothetical protein [Gemmatimonadota bacterium]
MAILTGLAALAGKLALEGGSRASRPGTFAVYVAGICLAAASSAAGFAALQWASRRGSASLRAALLTLLLGRVCLVVAFGAAIRALQPSGVAMGLISLVTFHFALMVLEIALLARPTGYAAAGGVLRRGPR